jgi:hypothetical protein
MTLYEYKLLDEMEQAEVLWDQGVLLGDRTDEEHKVLLYQIDGFYVEVFYSPKSNAIKRIRSFRSVDQLRSYLARIDIAALLQLFSNLFYGNCNCSEQFYIQLCVLFYVPRIDHSPIAALLIWFKEDFLSIHIYSKPMRKAKLQQSGREKQLLVLISNRYFK